jgi:hypothetical protein
MQIPGHYSINITLTEGEKNIHPKDATQYTYARNNLTNSTHFTA